MAFHSGGREIESSDIWLHPRVFADDELSRYQSQCYDTDLGRRSGRTKCLIRPLQEGIQLVFAPRTLDIERMGDHQRCLARAVQNLA